MRRCHVVAATFAAAPTLEAAGMATAAPTATRPPRADGPGAGAATLLGLQRTLGNQQVRRLIQRYALPASLPCNELVDWLDAHSPYAPEWAETRSTFTFGGRATLSMSPPSDGSFTARIKGHGGLTVSVASPVDRPTWHPGKRANRAAEIRAWEAMRTALDAHERQHQAIALQERARIEGEWQAIDITATGLTQSEARAAAAAALRAQQQAWQAQAQSAQDAIDPFRGAVLDCPSASTPP